ncbi:interferon alpha-13-like [Stegostoma tigrinum]|uniref:interferon alpha-13-like n=1 Tax=Stegostoma tigrinum TaxID=3053191 RepID=UPI00286FB5BD|nr:interferon alpha-13-like [Stegostoma tigrinum]
MALATVWRFWMVLGLVSGSLSLGCERLQLQQVLNTETLSKLHEIGGPFPLHCLSQRFSLKTKSLNLAKLSSGLEAQERIQIIHQTLHLINKIYRINLGSVTWAWDKVENYLLLLDLQLRELEDCLRKSGCDHKMKRNAAIQLYFRKLEKFLKHEKFSDCSWEIIHAESRARLQQLHSIMAQVSTRN